MNRFHYVQGNTEKFMWTDFTEPKHIFNNSSEILGDIGFTEELFFFPLSSLCWPPSKRINLWIMVISYDLQGSSQSLQAGQE